MTTQKTDVLFPEIRERLEQYIKGYQRKHFADYAEDDIATLLRAVDVAVRVMSALQEWETAHSEDTLVHKKLREALKEIEGLSK